jgi:hypothetical protein
MSKLRGEERTLARENCFNEGVDFRGENGKILLEQYKLYVETSSKVSDRRGSANTFLMSVNTALVAVYGLAAGKDASLDSKSAAAWLIPVAGLAISLGWIALISSYRALNRAKFDVINQIEEQLPARLFDAEWRYLNAEKTRPYLQLTYVEQLVPAVFAIIYAALLLIVTVP